MKRHIRLECQPVLAMQGGKGPSPEEDLIAQEAEGLQVLSAGCCVHDNLRVQILLHDVAQP